MPASDAQDSGTDQTTEVISLKYRMKAGKLYLGNDLLVQSKGRMVSPGKIICDREGRELLYTEIFQKDADASETGDMQGKASSSAENGFPVCRMPRVDHALMDIQGKTCVLIRKKWGEYVLQDEGGKVLMQIQYTGALGRQYEINTFSTWKPEMIAGIVQLSYYMERESEFLNV